MSDRSPAPFEARLLAATVVVANAAKQLQRMNESGDHDVKAVLKAVELASVALEDLTPELRRLARGAR